MSMDRLVTPYRELREATLARDRGLRDKVMSLEEAAKLVSDGDHVGIGGCHTSRTPFAMIWALIRARKKDLTISRSITSTEGDLLFASGVSRHVITSWFTQGIVWGVSKVMRHYTENKLARFEEWSHMSIGLRYRAGAMGLPFMPSRSMLGSDVAGRVAEQLRTMTCPFTGEELALLPALNPDVVLIHVQRCDCYGNAQIDGLQFMDIDMAMAANRVILSTERIVSNDQMALARPHAHSVLHRGGGGRGAAGLGAARMLRALRAVLPAPRCLRGALGEGPGRGHAAVSGRALLRAQVVDRLPGEARDGGCPRCVPPRPERPQ
jgi:glutaconate CoA-transferase subunit A